MIYAYPCQLSPDEDGGLVATFPDVPEAIAGGRGRAEALVIAEDRTCYGPGWIRPREAGHPHSQRDG